MSATSVFAGRWDDMNVLAACLNEAAGGEPRTVLIEGDAGIGKSALLAAFREKQEPVRERARFLLLCPPAEGAYDPVEQAVLAATHKRVLDRLGGKRSALDVLLEWIGAIPVVGNLVAAILATAEAVRRRRRSAVPRLTMDEDIEALLSLARRQTLVLLLDDLQRAERGAVARVENLVRFAGPGTRLLVVGAYCSTTAGSAEPPIRQLARSLPASRAVHRRLRGLTPKELASWLDKRFPFGARTPAFEGWLYEYTGGHPATVESTLARLLERGLIRFHDRHWEIEGDPDLLDLPAAAGSPGDLGDLPAAAAETIRAASVLGEGFDSVRLSRLLEEDELAVEDRLAVGVHYGLLVAIGEGETEDGEVTTLYRFGTPQLRAALYRALPAERRESLERRQEVDAAP
jgi:predicted ATPase